MVPLIGTSELVSMGCHALTVSRHAPAVGQGIAGAQSSCARSRRSIAHCRLKGKPAEEIECVVIARVAPKPIVVAVGTIELEVGHILQGQADVEPGL